MSATPVSLLERLQHPADPETWDRFVDLYTPLLYAWARRVGLPEPDVADLVQDVFVLLVQKLPEFRYDRGRSFRAWLKTVVLNQWRNNQRRKGRAVAVTSDDVAAVADPVDAAREFEEAEYRQYVVRRALDLIRAEYEPNTWTACWQYVVEGRPPQDIAAELGMTVNAVYLAKSRVLARLRRELEGLRD